MAEENVRLREEVAYLRQRESDMREEVKELERLRVLMDVPPAQGWEQTSARVVAGRFGPQAVLNSVMLNKGFLSGAVPGAPVVARQGLVGRVFRAAPSSSNVILLNDPVFRIAVIGQESRVRGILAGAGAGQPLEVLYASPNTHMREGELLICSGIDGSVPKGVPAARITETHYDKDMLAPQIYAEPVAPLASLEEVTLLVPPKGQRIDELILAPYTEGDGRGPDARDGLVSDEEAAENIGN